MAHRLPEAFAPEPTLRVLPRGLALVQDYRALIEAGVNRFHGWRFDSTLGPEFVDPADKQVKNHGGRVKQTDQVIEIGPDDPHRVEYLRHLRDGDLWAADEDTARAASVPFEPHFLGEHPETSAKHGVDPFKDPAIAAAAKALAAGLPWDTSFKPKVVPLQTTPAADKNAPPAKVPALPPTK